MIPLYNGENNNSNDNISITVNRYTTKDVNFNYLNYHVDKINTDNNKQKFLYTSQVKKEDKDNKFILTYSNTSGLFEFSPLDCYLDVLMIPSSLAFVDDGGNITDSNNNLQFVINQLNIEDYNLQFKSLIFQSGLSNISTLEINYLFSTIETIILNDNYFDNIEIGNIPNLKNISPLKGKNILIYQLPHLKSLLVDNCDNVNINNCANLEHLEINKAETVIIRELTHLKTCIGKTVKTLKLKNIRDESIHETPRGRTKLLDFRNTEEVEFEYETGDTITNKFEYCYLDNLKPENSKANVFMDIDIGVLRTKTIYVSNESGGYTPLFSESPTHTHIGIVIFTGENSYYDMCNYNTDRKFEPDCVKTIYFEDIDEDINNVLDVKNIYRGLFSGGNNSAVYISGPTRYAPHAFDDNP